VKASEPLYGAGVGTRALVGTAAGAGVAGGWRPVTGDDDAATRSQIRRWCGRLLLKHCVECGRCGA
jgi:hypothetical protein